MTVILERRSGALRHPEKQKNTPTQRQKKPPWLRVRARVSPGFAQTRAIMQRHNLVTVCEEAGCPNIAECWEKKHATIMIMGDICTRACAFCNVATGIPHGLDADEPRRVADSLAELGLEHIVITSVDRDDLKDGGGAHFAKVITAIRQTSPHTTIEVLTPDFLRKPGALELVLDAAPDVFNHNLETVPKLYRTIRPGSRYYHSLRLLDDAKRYLPGVFTKSGLMVGLGEARSDILQVMDDMRSAEVDFLTIGQYLQPTARHAAVDRFVAPKEFDELRIAAEARGFLLVAASPLTRSSYHAGEDFARLQAARRAKTSLATKAVT